MGRYGKIIAIVGLYRAIIGLIVLTCRNYFSAGLRFFICCFLFWTFFGHFQTMIDYDDYVPSTSMSQRTCSCSDHILSLFRSCCITSKQDDLMSGYEHVTACDGCSMLPQPHPTSLCTDDYRCVPSPDNQ